MRCCECTEKGLCARAGAGCEGALLRGAFGGLIGPRPRGLIAPGLWRPVASWRAAAWRRGLEERGLSHPGGGGIGGGAAELAWRQPAWRRVDLQWDEWKCCCDEAGNNVGG
ncbi:hypothetical protein NDU88_007082 [Pleurodeles waltl]|uniref:Uncharacterized protein n=1 Tax=Pleurodeles waltl TaxID=8319 RepID=A0AAV7P171_PLEWA|nr:hypothetical protein NDU88_007082 [Pleurodeles waltl]